jgi:hypothetical protein
MKYTVLAMIVVFAGCDFTPLERKGVEDTQAKEKRVNAMERFRPGGRFQFGSAGSNAFVIDSATGRVFERRETNWVEALPSQLPPWD